MQVDLSLEQQRLATLLAERRTAINNQQIGETLLTVITSLEFGKRSKEFIDLLNGFRISQTAMNNYLLIATSFTRAEIYLFADAAQKIGKELPTDLLLTFATRPRRHERNKAILHAISSGWSCRMARSEVRKLRAPAPAGSSKACRSPLIPMTEGVLSDVCRSVDALAESNRIDAGLLTAWNDLHVEEIRAATPALRAQLRKKVIALLHHWQERLGSLDPVMTCIETIEAELRLAD